MSEGQVQRAWPDPPPGSRPPPGTRAWRVYRELRRRGMLTVHRLGCAVLVLVLVAVAALALLDHVADGAASLFVDEPDVVGGSPFDTVAPTAKAPSGSDVIEGIDGLPSLIVGVQESPGLAEKSSARNYTGFDVALAELIAREVGPEPLRIKYKPLTADFLVGTLTRSETNIVIGGFEITHERHSQVAFAGPTLTDQVVLAVPSDSPTVDLATLGDDRVCVAEDSTAEQLLAPQLGGRLRTAGSLKICLQERLGSSTDAVAGDERTLQAAVADKPGQFTIIGAPLGQTSYGFGLASDDDVFRNRVQDVLRRAQADGTWTRLYEQYLGAPAPPPPLGP